MFLSSYKMNRLSGIFGRKVKKVSISDRKAKKIEEQRILAELEDKKTDGTRYIAVICDELDDRILHDMTQTFDELDHNIKHIYLILHVSDGGTAHECTILNRLFFKFLKIEGHQLTICVPEMALSSGAQLAICGGSSLIMGRFAHLSPFDDQLGNLGAKNIKRIAKKMNKMKMKQDFTLKEYDTLLRAEYIHKITVEEVNSVLSHRGVDRRVIKRVRKLFLNHKLYHSYPIDIDMVKETGLQVAVLEDKDVIKTFLELYELWLDDEE